MCSTKLYTSTPLEPVTAIEERLQWKIKDVSSFNISVKITEQKTTFFRENNKSEKYYEKYKISTIKRKSFDTFIVFDTISFYHIICCWNYFIDFTNISWKSIWMDNQLYGKIGDSYAKG